MKIKVMYKAIYASLQVPSKMLSQVFYYLPYAQWKPSLLPLYRGAFYVTSHLYRGKMGLNIRQQT